MKMRKMSVLLMVVVMLTACGTKETVDTDVNKPVDKEVVNDLVATPEASEPVSTPEPAAPVMVSDKIDKIVDVDIPVGSQSEKVGLPELHLYVTGELVEQVSSGTTKYAIPNDTIHLKISARYYKDTISCWETYQVPHYETTDYGRYVVDVDYQENISYGSTYITVFDSQLNCGIEIEVALGAVNETAPTEKQQAYIKDYALAEAEYIKEQVSAWPQDFVPVSGTEASAAAPVETASGEIPYGRYICADINKYMQITVEDGEFNVIMFGDSGTSGVDCMFDIVWVEGNTYSIELSEKYGIATLTDGSIQVTADKDELKMYEGSYVVQ